MTQDAADDRDPGASSAELGNGLWRHDDVSPAVLLDVKNGDELLGRAS